MKKIILFSIGVLVYLTLVVSCGPSARDMEEWRLADSVRVASDSSRDMNAKSVCDRAMQTMKYYKDETTGLHYAVVENNGQIVMVLIPSNMLLNTPNLRTFKSR